MKQLLVVTLAVWQINEIISSIFWFPLPKAMAKLLGTIVSCRCISLFFSTARWAVAISDDFPCNKIIAVIRIHSALLRWWPNCLQVDDSRLPWCNDPNPWCVSFGAGELMGIMIYDEVGCKLRELIYDFIRFSYIFIMLTDQLRCFETCFDVG